MPEAIRLRIENVQVDADNYDPSVAPPRPSLFCRLLGASAGVAVAGVVGGAVESVCSSLTGADGKIPDRRAEAPDITIGLKVGEHVLYRSPTNYNTFSSATGHSFVIPVAALRPEGIFLIVQDEDNEGQSYEQIGSFRLTRDELLALRGRGVQRLQGEEGRNAGDFEVVVADFAPADVEVDLAADKGTMRTGLDVPAGAALELEASGRYRISRNKKVPEIGPEGLPNSTGREGSYFRDALHGAAFVAVGDGNHADSIIAGTACRRRVGVKAGFAVIGINDRGDLRDNSGRVHFVLRLRSPDPGEWGKPPPVSGACRPRG